MRFEDAKQILDTCTRHECRDHVFGKRSVCWARNGLSIAEGTAGYVTDIWFVNERAVKERILEKLTKEEKLALFDCGEPGRILRNDYTGPDTYKDGLPMPGLSPAKALEELRRREG